MYTKQQIERAIEQLKELVVFETGLPVEKISWSPDNMAADIIRMLEGGFEDTLAEMRKATSVTTAA